MTPRRRRLPRPTWGRRVSGAARDGAKTDQNAFSLPSANLAPTRRLDFSVGKQSFPQSMGDRPGHYHATARDGLGPLLNPPMPARTATSRTGAAIRPCAEANNAVLMLVVVCRSPDSTRPYAKVIEQLGIVPEPVYGGQLQDMAVPGVVPEGKVRVELHTGQRHVQGRHGGRVAQAEPAHYPASATGRCTPIRGFPPV